MLDGLTPRQKEIVSLIEQGRSNKEIAALLDIGVGTVKQHVAALFRRLNVTSRAQAIAVLRGLSSSEPLEIARPGSAARSSSTSSVGQETSALGGECRVVSVAAIILEPAESTAQTIGTRRLIERLESLVGLGRLAAELLGGQCFERAGQGIELRFGLVRARADDASRAIRAARFVLDRMLADDDDDPKPRGGIATGVGVVLAQGGQAARPLACAELSNAWRLAFSAPVGRLLACEATQRLTADTLTFEAQSSAQGLGRSALVRGEALLHPPANLPPPRLLLAERVLELLGQTNCLLIEAGSGLGKTSLAASLAQKIEAKGETTLYIPAGRPCLGPEPSALAAGLEIKLGLGFSDEPNLLTARLEAFLSAQGGVGNDVRQPLLDLLFPAARTPSNIPELALAVAALAKAHPLTLLIDDVQAAAPALIELLALLKDAASPGLRLVLFSDGHNDAVLQRLAPLERLKMSPLSEEDMLLLIKGLDGNGQLDEGLTRAVVRQAQGRPGDATELVTALLSRMRTKGDGQLPQGLPMPIRLYAGLIAEMDQDSDQREVLRLAALLGRFFAASLLARFWPRGQKALDDALTRAVRERLLIQEGSGTSIRYSFARPLLREAAILSWLAADRTRTKARIERTRVRVGAVPLAPMGMAVDGPVQGVPDKELEEL
jgi:DNA-binding CsgD family transcriptional regulator